MSIRAIEFFGLGSATGLIRPVRSGQVRPAKKQLLLLLLLFLLLLLLLLFLLFLLFVLFCFCCCCHSFKDKLKYFRLIISGLFKQTLDRVLPVSLA